MKNLRLKKITLCEKRCPCSYSKENIPGSEGNSWCIVRNHQAAWSRNICSFQNRTADIGYLQISSDRSPQRYWSESQNLPRPGRSFSDYRIFQIFLYFPDWYREIKHSGWCSTTAQGSDRKWYKDLSCECSFSSCLFPIAGLW